LHWVPVTPFHAPALRRLIAYMHILKLIILDLIRINQLYGHYPSPSFFHLIKALLSPRYTPIFIYRVSHSFHRLHIFPLSWLLSRINQLLYGIEIAPACRIGPGLFLPHTYGTVIGAASIGSNATIFQGSTLGAKHLVFNYLPSFRPKLGSGITVGAGSKVLGDVTIGDNVVIGANAVVLSSLPANCLAVGIPAKPRTLPTCG
jgi:serine O-acetyltransferase